MPKCPRVAVVKGSLCSLATTLFVTHEVALVKHAWAGSRGDDARFFRLSTAQTSCRSRTHWLVTPVKPGKTWYLPRSSLPNTIGLDGWLHAEVVSEQARNCRRE